MPRFAVATPVACCCALAVTLAAAGCRPATPEAHYGFITRLGRDTIALESVTRRGNTVITDAVDRFPRVRKRHGEIELAGDGSIRRLVMDIHTPSEPLKQRERRVVAEVTADSVRVEKTDETGTVKRAFARKGGVAMAHVPQEYALYELYFAAALRRAAGLKRGPGDTVMMRQFYIDREFDDFPLHHGVVRVGSGGKAEISHDWLSGSGDATVDSAYHLLTYNGARSTYDVQVQRLDSAPDVAAFAAAWETLEINSGGVRQLSVRDTVRATIGTASLTVDYSRPLARGRELLGNVIVYDKVWRTGANAATQLTTTAPITLAGLELPAATYTLWTVPHPDGRVELIVNRESGQWGTRYNAAKNLGRAPLTVGVPKEAVEKFTIAITADGGKRGTLSLAWGPWEWRAPIVAK